MRRAQARDLLRHRSIIEPGIHVEPSSPPPISNPRHSFPAPPRFPALASSRLAPKKQSSAISQIPAVEDTTEYDPNGTMHTLDRAPRPCYHQVQTPSIHCEGDWMHHSLHSLPTAAVSKHKDTSVIAQMEILLLLPSGFYNSSDTTCTLFFDGAMGVVGDAAFLEEVLTRSILQSESPLRAQSVPGVGLLPEISE
ncbi:uncharacterized protein EKO05_0007995 [Ascochyta rabiei]|uniref:Uncharacterized protein n=1 Tax=Didymella rabiei TaxID=5454 RepID=A0A163BAL1_DIDRA|nr:uncharacterized protein EKO05_0007995 [Ascochyta rabiei]KZM21659.1 hypothetical protein ST47_g7256 [Ascochyta rabiei]UPX17654.1 hypothetical protein EKO05_0007995 [Ascochyta rabiei]